MNASDDQQMHQERATAVSEDPNVMTIEFLRARLQTERSISKSATQRADELAKRVAELEEQLEIATSQRKKAEEATANLLSILKHNDLSNASATPDSSNKDYPSELNEKEEQSLLCSETESSCQTDGFLTWNNTKSTSKPVEKNISKHRRCNSVSSFPPSTPQRSGKSCRQIHLNSRFKNDSEMMSQAESKDSKDAEPDEIPRKKNDAKSLEMAIMQRQQLIGQYEAMEKAQTEWEEKFNESNSDSCDNGNHSDITEETIEPRMNPKEEFSFPTEKSTILNPQIGKITELSLTLYERKEPENIEGILDALNQAKLCLKRKMATSSPPTIGSLFRLPTDSLTRDFSLPLMDTSSSRYSKYV